jgi:uncharacterized membrane protein
MLTAALLLALLLAGAVATMVGLVASSRRPSWVAPAGRACRVVALLLLAAAGLGTASGLIATYGALGAPGLTDRDRDAMERNGQREALFNALIGLVVALPPLLLSRKLKREQDVQRGLS